MRVRKCLYSGSGGARSGFTLIELLVVIAIIALLVGISIPAMSAARRIARESRAKANITGLHQALETFNSELGYYPDSGRGFDTGTQLQLDTGPVAATPPDQGAHVLFEALTGLDTLGYAKSGIYGETTLNNVGEPIERRYGPYVQAEDIGSATMDMVQPDGTNWVGAAYANPVFVSEVRPGVKRAILYFKANRTKRLHFQGDYTPRGTPALIYNYWDNGDIIQDNNLHVADDGHGWGTEVEVHFYGVANNQGTLCPHSIFNPDTGMGVATNLAARPYNPETFLLVDAGYDGVYGTDDDITNFRQ